MNHAGAGIMKAAPTPPARNSTPITQANTALWLPGVRELAADGVVTGASGRNWASYGEGVALGAGIDQVKRDLLTDPQTSGGLLVSCAPQALGEVLEIFQDEGFAEAAIIGETRAGEARVEVA